MFYRSLTVGGLLLEAIGRPLSVRADRASAAATAAPPLGEPAPAGSAPTVLSTLDLSRSVPKKVYAHEVKRLQGRLYRLHRQALAREISTLAVFEGWDAAGKGGAWRRSTPGTWR